MVGKDLLKILKESKYTTVLSGFEMLQENGYPAIRDGEESYDIEQKYGYSVDEMFTSAFYSTRKPQFFEFYRNELLSALDIPPGKGYLEMAELEEKVKNLTQRIAIQNNETAHEIEKIKAETGNNEYD